MSAEIDLAILLIAEVLFGILVASYSAMQFMAYEHAENDDDEDGGFAGKLLEKPVANYFALGIGRLVMLGVVVAAALRFAAHLPAPLNGTVGLVAAALICVGLPMIVGNALAVQAPARLLQGVRFAIYPAVYVLYPLAALTVAVLRRIAPGVLDALAFHVLPLKRKIEIVDHSNGEDQDEQDLVTSVFEFHDTKVKEIMVPRIDMVAVNLHLDATEAIDTIIDAGHSRVPVFDESIDRVVGVVHTKDMLKVISAGESPNLNALKREVYFVPESKKIDELLSEFKARRIHIAIVVDEYGGTAGLITLEDILEELVGDIQDEFDEEEALVQRIDEDSALCSSRARVDELAEELGIVLEETDADTLGGYLYENFGRVPPVGATFAQGEIVFKVDSVRRLRIDKVLITGLSAADGSVRDNVS